MVPNGWERHLVGKICSSIVPGRNKPKSFGGDIAWVTVPEIKSRYIPSNIQENYVSEDVINECGGKIVPEGAVVMSAVGDLGLVAITKEQVVLNQQLHAFVCSPKINNEYLAYWLVTQKPFMESIASRTTILYLNKSNCESIPVLVPPLPEQQKIAEVLTTWDKAIDTTERLIDNSKQQKKALMQQLLTGKQRFDFEKNSYELKQTRYGDIPKDWEYVKIKDIAKQLTKKNSDNNDYPVISCSKHYGFVNSLEYFKKQVFSDNTTGYRIIPRDCFGFPANHIEEGSIGLQTTHDFALVSPIYVVFEANQQLVNNIYLYALLKTEHYRQIFSASTNASVDRRGSLRWKEFSEIRIPLPPLEEQQKIAAVLTNTDKEIELLEQQLADLQQEKKALMQVLLMGKVRVGVGV